MRVVLGIVPARGGSKGIPRKNLASLGGRPLIEYTFRAAQGSQLLSRIILSTEDDEIAQFGASLNIEVPFHRPLELAMDTTPMLAVVQHAVRILEEREGYTADDVVLLQPTAPLRTSRHIDDVIRLLWATGDDSVISVCEVPHQFNPYFTLRLEEERLSFFLNEGARFTRRQDLPPVYSRNGAVYACKRTVLMENNSWFGEECRAYLMERLSSVNVDEPIDLLLAEAIIKMQKEKGQ